MKCLGGHVVAVGHHLHLLHHTGCKGLAGGLGGLAGGLLGIARDLMGDCAMPCSRWSQPQIGLQRVHLMKEGLLTKKGEGV